MDVPAKRPRSAAPLPGTLMAEAMLAAGTRALAEAWRGSLPHRLSLIRPTPQGLAVRPHDRRPAHPEAGRQKLDGRWAFFGEVMEVSPQADPWDRPSPSERHAAGMHGFEWLGDVLAAGEPAGALRLCLDWRRLFGGWNAFAWTGRPLERRVFNWACALPALAQPASEAELTGLMQDLGRQARCLLGVENGDRGAERAAAAAIAGCVLAGRSGEAILEQALRRLERILPRAVLPDGGHATRAPERALELLLDLLTLDDGLSQLGQPPPPEVSRAIDRLFTAVRALTLADGRLPCLQGGAESRKARIAAALAADDGAGRRPTALPDSGYQRLENPELQVMFDAGAPAQGRWSLSAVAQPLAVEIVAGGRRLITQVGWTADSGAPGVLRLADGGSTASLGESSAGAPARGFIADALGPRLVGAPRIVVVRRSEGPDGVWLEAGHDGWLASLGLWCERRLFLGPDSELRGEDRFRPQIAGDPKGPRRYVPYVVRFHLYPEVSALVARDKRSVLLKAGSDAGWRLRNDATDVLVEPSMHYQNGEPRRTQQIVLRGQIRGDQGGRVRWKLTKAEA